VDAALTLAEASQVLQPPMTERQLRQIVTALGWPPAGWRRTGRQGHPCATYPWHDLTQLHSALLPWLGMTYPKPQATALPGPGS
jgi:hypothetical protein